MASAFSHVAIPIALRLAGGQRVSARLLTWGMILSAIPDLDSIAFRFGIPYESQWGHRGFTHSLLAAFVVGILSMLFWKSLRSSRAPVFWISFLSMASHGVLDAMTTGGLGVAFFWPWDLERYFLPWKVIAVSPIGVSQFFTERGLNVLKSEFVYVWLPALSLGLICAGLRKRIRV
jgi:inner membrane protein